MKSFILSYPSWYILLCIALGLLVSGILYFKSSHFRDKSLLRGILGVLRFLTVSALAFLLLQPLLRFIQTQEVAPKVLLFVDNSLSLQEQFDESRLDSLANTVASSLEEKGIDLRQYYFGGTVDKEYDRTDTLTTNISETVHLAYGQYSNENVCGIVVMSDGIFNQGKNPLYLDRYTEIPVYTVGLGDTTRYPDLYLRNVFYNKIAYTGDKMEIEVDLQRSQSDLANSRILVDRIQGENTRRVAQTSVEWSESQDLATTAITLDLEDVGVHQYRIYSPLLPTETNKRNNYKDIFIRVLESRKSIAILARNPHPDIAAIRQVLGDTKNYEVSVHYPESNDFEAEKADLILLHQLPSVDRNESNKLLDQALASKKPLWIIVGAKTSTNRLNDIQDLIKIEGGNKRKEDVRGVAQADFTLFELDDQWNDWLDDLPPLRAPFGKFTTGPAARVLFDQSISRIQTEYPLVLYGENRSRRMMIMNAEGIWRWKLYNYLQEENFDLVGEWLEQSIQYLSTKEDKRRFRTEIPKYLYSENEAISVQAELYTKAYELNNDPEVQLEIKNTAGEQFEFVMDRQGKAYALALESLSPGSYTYEATTNYDGESFVDQGKFNIQDIQLEKLNTQADFDMLREWSKMTDGKFYTASEINNISSEWDANRLKPVLYQTAETRPLFHWKWLLPMLLLPLCIEWFLRRYNGQY